MFPTCPPSAAMSEKSAPIALQPMGSSSHLPYGAASQSHMGSASHLPTGSFSNLPNSSSQAAPSSPAPPAAPMPHPDPEMDLPPAYPAYPEPSYEAHARTPTPPSAPKLTPAQIGEQYRAERASIITVATSLADHHSSLQYTLCAQKASTIRRGSMASVVSSRPCCFFPLVSSVSCEYPPYRCGMHSSYFRLSSLDTEKRCARCGVKVKKPNKEKKPKEPKQPKSDVAQ